MAIAIYGVLRAGAAFSPINPTTTPANARAHPGRPRRRHGALRRRERRGGAGRERARRRGARRRRRARRGRTDRRADDGRPRPRRRDLHVRLHRRAEGRDPDPRQHDLRRGLDQRVPRDDAATIASSACCRSRSATGSTSCSPAFGSAATLVLEPGLGAARPHRRAARAGAHHRLPGGPDHLPGAALARAAWPSAGCEHLRFVTNAGAGLPEAVVASLRATMPEREHLPDVRADRVPARLLPAARPGRGAPDVGPGSRSRAPRRGSRTGRASGSGRGRSGSWWSGART